MTPPSLPHGRASLGSLIAVLIAVFAAGCTVGSPGGAATPSAERRLTAPPPAGLVTVPPSAEPIVGEVPAAVLLRIREDLAGRLGVDVSRAIVVRSEAVTWSDGSLGCPEPGMFYTQALVPGYHVVLELDGQRYDYRSDERGNVRLCEPRAPVGQP